MRFDDLVEMDGVALYSNQNRDSLYVDVEVEFVAEIGKRSFKVAVVVGIRAELRRSGGTTRNCVVASMCVPCGKLMMSASTISVSILF